MMDSIVGGTGVRLTRVGLGTSLYSRLFVAGRTKRGFILVAFPFDPSEDAWSGIVTGAYEFIGENGLCLKQHKYEDIHLYPLGPVDEEIKMVGKASTWTMEDARQIGRSQWGLIEAK